MKGHDGLCPSPNPALIDRKNCAYCNLIEKTRNHYKTKGKSEGKTYEDGWHDGQAELLRKMQEAAG
jgi:hypothetical protein